MKGQRNLNSLSFNSDGLLTTKLPQGNPEDDYQLYVTVLIKDESNGITRFEFNHSIQVYPDPNLKNELIMALVNKDIRNDFYNSLKSGNLKETAGNILGLVSMLNIRPNVSNSTGNVTFNATEENYKAIARIELVTALGALTVSDISSIKLISAALDGLSNDPAQTSRDSAVSEPLI
jgi:hypothetical protein